MNAAMRLARAGMGLGLALCAGAASAVTCSLSSVPVAFPPYDVYATGATNSNGKVTVACQLTGELILRVNYTVSLSAGSSNSYVQRKLKHVTLSDQLGYNLYTSNTYSVVWGDGNGGSSTQSGSFTLTFITPSGSAGLTVYGQVPPLQDVSVGSYNDSIVATVNY